MPGETYTIVGQENYDRLNEYLSNCSSVHKENNFVGTGGMYFSLEKGSVLFIDGSTKKVIAQNISSELGEEIKEVIRNK